MGDLCKKKIFSRFRTECFQKYCTSNGLSPLPNQEILYHRQLRDVPDTELLINFEIHFSEKGEWCFS